MGTFVVSAELKTEFERMSSTVSKSKGAVLFRRGDPAHGVFLIRKGKVRVELDSAGRIFPTQTLGPGSVAGLPASVSGAAYSLTAKVAEDSELGYIPRGQLIKLLGCNPQLCMSAMKVMSREISRMRAALKVYKPE